MAFSLNTNTLGVHGRMTVASATRLLGEALGSPCSCVDMKTDPNGKVEITIETSTGAIDPELLESYKAIIANVFALSKQNFQEVVITMI